MIKNKLLVLFFVISFFFSSVGSAISAGSMKDVLSDSFYGGLVGALIGGGFLLIEDTSDKTNEEKFGYITTGAGVGILAGAVYGLYSANRRSLLEVRNGKVYSSFPHLRTKVGSINNSKFTETTMDLFSAKF